METASHPIVGTWIVDTATATDTDSPEVGIFHGDGTMAGPGANRSAGGTWEVVDDIPDRLTLVTISDSNGVGAYVVVRGTYVLDDTGNRWTCDDCAYTVANSNGTVLDSGTAPASAVRMPVESPDAVGGGPCLDARAAHGGYASILTPDIALTVVVRPSLAREYGPGTAPRLYGRG